MRPTVGGGRASLQFVDTHVAIEPAEAIYTLLGVRADGVASVVDVVRAEDLSIARRCAEALLHEHQSCSVVELWRDGALVEQLDRTADA